LSINTAISQKIIPLSSDNVDKFLKNGEKFKKGVLDLAEQLSK
jgi:microcompartment protein CcmL/EutN